MVNVVITTKWLDAQLGKHREKILDVPDKASGLWVRISTKGKIIFHYRYRFSLKNSRIDLGEYPVMNLKEARDDLLKWKAVLANGDDPRTVRQLDKTARLAPMTNEQVIREWFDRYLVKRRKRTKEIINRFELHIFPAIGMLPAEHTERRHWLQIFDRLVDDGKHGMVDKLLADSKQALAFAENRQTITKNSLATLNLRDLGVVRAQGERTLNNAELALVWGKIEKSGLCRKNQIMTLLIILFGCRTVELRLSKKSHFDLDSGIWTVPPELTKNLKKEVKRPIIDFAKTLLQEAIAMSETDFLFTTFKGTPMAETTPTKWPSVLMKNFKMDHWSMHDLRRTARTNFSSFTAPHIAEKMLGHKLSGVWAIYDKHEYIEEQRIAYEAWLSRLDAIATGDNVVVFERKLVI